MSLLTLENITTAPIEEGDAGIILKADGSFRIFNTHKDIAANELTEGQLAQGRRMMALAVALKYPEVMQALEDAAAEIIQNEGPIQFGILS